MSDETFYREIIIEHNQRPEHKACLSAPTDRQDGVNASCGDTLTVELTVDEGVISEVGFAGQGCAISQAATDLLLGRIKGESVAAAQTVLAAYKRLLEGRANASDRELLGELVALEQTALLPGRIKCATLGLHTLEKMLLPHTPNL